MRADPVNRDTIDLLVTAAYITTPVFLIDHPVELIARADQLGQVLWDMNHASVSHAIGKGLPAPRYEWQPVAEIIPVADDEQLLQVERSRLFYMEVSSHHPDWDDSPVRELVDHLGVVLGEKLEHLPLVRCPDQVGVMEPAGLSSAVEMWKRSIGFRFPLVADAAAA